MFTIQKLRENDAQKVVAIQPGRTFTALKQTNSTLIEPTSISNNISYFTSKISQITCAAKITI